jgi:hypothetical protein
VVHKVHLFHLDPGIESSPDGMKRI